MCSSDLQRGGRGKWKIDPDGTIHIPRADLLEKDLDELVGEVLSRMTPEQIELRCTHNKVHFVLSDQHQLDPIWSRPETRTLLGKGPKFTPMASSLREVDVSHAVANLQFRMVRAFERFANKAEYERKDNVRRAAGIQDWFPKRQKRSEEECRTYVQDFFSDARQSGTWARNKGRAPSLKRRLFMLGDGITEAVKEAKSRVIPTRHRKPNLSKGERAVLVRLREMDIGYNVADKNYGAVVYSRDLFIEQCRLHLEDGKGTYYKIVGRSDEDILEDVVFRLRMILMPFKEKGEAWASTALSILNDSERLAVNGKLCKFYIIWKLHKAASSSGLRSRPIASATSFVTMPASHFLDRQLKKAVWSHPYVLKDSRELVRILQGLEFAPGDRVMLTAADVNSLYPSIQLDRGMRAMQWFLDNHTDFNSTLKDLCLKLAEFVLTSNYVKCEELGPDPYLQVVGTAMGTSFSVVYAVIFMIHLETPIIHDERFSRYVLLYKRFIDDLFLIWTGPADVLCEFRRAFGSADPRISLEWAGYNSQQEAVTPECVTAERHARVNFMDLDLALKRERTRTLVSFRPYRKPGNAYAYIPFTSFHGRHTFRGWVLAELLRLLTHCSSEGAWMEEARFFYNHLRARGYPGYFLEQVFNEVAWSRRAVAMESRSKSDDFFKTYRACVLTLRNAPEWPFMRELMDLNLSALREETWGDIFPVKVFLAQSNAPRLGSILKK